MDAFEYLVSLSLPLVDFIAAHTHLTTIGTAISVFSTWFIFHFHYSKVTSEDYLRQHPEIAVRFSRPTYEMFQYIAMAVLPCAIFVFIFSIVTKFNSEMFLSAFSVKGRLNPFARYKNRAKFKAAKRQLETE